MALVFADRVRETTSTAGTGTFSLLGAVNSCQSFSAIGNGNTTYYTAVSQVGTEWEVGLGTYNAGTLTRDTILSSSNSGSIVNFSAGTKDVFCDYPAGKAVLVDGSGNTYAPNIGGTTASAGTFTGVNVKSSSQNLFWSTTTFGSGWSIGSGTNTLSAATTDPFGGTSVYKLVANAGFDPNTGSSAILSFASQTFPVGGFYTESIYFKAAETNALRIRNNATGEIYTFTIGTTPTATAGVLTPQLIFAGSGWYRASWTFVNGNVAGSGRSDVWSLRLAVTGDGTSGVYISSPQLEYGTAVSAYLANTTGASIYGVPAISFNGVSSIAVDLKGNLSLQPAIGAAIQAQASTSTVAGGNPRGTYAVDFQTNRDTAAKVASGSSSFVGSGYANSATNGSSIVIGGAFNTASGESAIVAGGSVNRASGKSALILGGTGNTSDGTYNVVVGGFQNAGTASAAVTTQSATMNGTTAVTLSGSNASIKVGQLVLGTNIDYYGTYVAAISGTSLTLSTAATGSGVATLSFYTPHGVVVGGGNNQATGSYSFVGAGGDAGTAASRNVASGDWSVVVGGMKNTASGIASFVGGGGFDGTTFRPNTASGQNAIIVGGANSTASSTRSVVLGGWTISNAGYEAFVGGGSSHSVTGQWAAIGGGAGNTVNGYAAFIGSGASNIANGYYNVIAGGYANSGTASAAVTTQSATMDGTVNAVLSGSNASIKVGQWIGGTNIAGETYVAAISGTALTLSRVASGSGTATLSFYTPHGVVVGGGNNQATGSYSFIGGGGDAGTAANRNVASGDWSVVGGGRGNSATGSGAVIGGGGVFSGAVNVTYPQTASGSASFIGGGLSNIASGAYASVLAGLANTANGIGSTAVGLQATTRGITGYYAYSGCDGAVSFTSGTSQTGLLTLGRQTTDATPTVLTSNTNAGATTNQVILPNNSAYYFKGSVIANVTGAANGAAWSFEGAIMRGANAGTTVLIGTVTLNRVAATAGASLWVVALTADTANGGLAVTVTGTASTTIRWVAKVETTEVTF